MLIPEKCPFCGTSLIESVRKHVISEGFFCIVCGRWLSKLCYNYPLCNFCSRRPKTVADIPDTDQILEARDMSIEVDNSGNGEEALKGWVTSGYDYPRLVRTNEGREQDKEDEGDEEWEEEEAEE